MIQINSNFSISRLNNPEITAFYINVQKAINTATPENLGIGEMYPAYNAKLQREAPGAHRPRLCEPGLGVHRSHEGG